MIRKLGKAHWDSWCTICEAPTAPSVDRLGAMEAEKAHRESLDHLRASLGKGLQPLTDAFNSIIKAVADVSEVMQSSFALAPPPNRPHDPALLRDKRKWGGQ